MSNRNNFIKDFENYINKFLIKNDYNNKWIDVLTKNVLEPKNDKSEWFAELAILQNKYGFDFDMFGTYLEEKNLTRKGLGQFFTPMHVAKIMTTMTFGENIQEILDNKYMNVHDPCSGSGRFMIAHSEESKSKFKQFWTPTTFQYINVDLDYNSYIFSALNAILRNLYSINVYGNSITSEVYGAIITAPTTIGMAQWHSNVNLDKIKEILTNPIKNNNKKNKKESMENMTLF